MINLLMVVAYGDPVKGQGHWGKLVSVLGTIVLIDICGVLGDFPSYVMMCEGIALFVLTLAGFGVWLHKAWRMATVYALPPASRAQGVRTLLQDPMLYYHVGLLTCCALGETVHLQLVLGVVRCLCSLRGWLYRCLSSFSRCICLIYLCGRKHFCKCCLP